MLPIKKLYIHSMYKTDDSVSDSNFKCELPQSIHMPHNSVFYVTDVCIPNVWRTVETGVNDKIYISTGLSNPLSVLGPTSIIWQDETITLQPGYYSEADFASALQTALQTTHPFTVSLILS